MSNLIKTRYWAMCQACGGLLNVDIEINVTEFVGG